MHDTYTLKCTNKGKRKERHQTEYIHTYYNYICYSAVCKNALFNFVQKTFLISQFWVFFEDTTIKYGMHLQTNTSNI